MLRIGWQPPEIPDFDPEIHNPEKVFAFLCYRGIHYASGFILMLSSMNNGNYLIQEERVDLSSFFVYNKSVSYTHLTLPTKA